MKQKIYIFGVITALIIFTGAIFKVNHFPGAGILLTAGLVTFIVGFIPAALVSLYKAEEPRQNLLLYIVTGITCFVVFTGMLFKIQHWQFAGVMLMVALPFPYVVFLPVFLSVTSRKKNFNIYNIVAVLSLLAFNSVFSTMLALNVAKSRIEDSYNLSRNYNKLEKVLEQIPGQYAQNPVNTKIDEVLKIVNEYQELILKSEGTSLEQWNSKPGNLWRPDERTVPVKVLFTVEGASYGGRLEEGLENLYTEMQNTRGYERLSKVAPMLFDLKESTDAESTWGERIFRDNTVSWTLTYLDGLKTNLHLIKATVNTGY